MNWKIKKITKEYLNTFSHISEEEKEKIANLNANSEWIVFSGRSLTGAGAVSAYGLAPGQSYKGIVRADQDGYLLEDLGEFPESFHGFVKNKRREKEGHLLAAHSGTRGGALFEYFNENIDGYYRLRGIKGIDWRLDEEGYVQFHDTDGWFYKTYVINELISGREFQVSDELADLLTETWKEILKENGVDIDKNLTDNPFYYDLLGVNFLTNQIPLTSTNSGYLHAVYYPVFPRNEKNSFWLAVKKEVFSNETETIISGMMPFQSSEKYKISKNLDDFNLREDMPSTVPPLVPRPSPTPHTPVPSDPPFTPEPLTEDERIVLIGSELIEIADKNNEFVQRGKDLGLDLREISGDESWEFNEVIDWNFPLNHPNNAEANRIEKFIRDTFRENQRKLAEAEMGRGPNHDPDPSLRETLEQVRNQAITAITQLMTKESAISDDDLLENNRDWKALISNSNDPEKIKELKTRIVADIHSKKKENAFSTRLVELLEKAETEEDYEKLKDIFVEVEKGRKYDVYNKLANKINALKEKLARKNPNDYLDTNVQNVENEMKKRGLDKNDLDDKGQAALNNLKNGANPDAVNNLTKVVVNSINRKDAENKLDKLLEKYKNAPNEVSKEVAKKQIINFINNREIAYQEVYQNRKSELDNLLGINSSQGINNNGFPVVPTIIFGCLGVFLVSLIIIVIQKNPKKRK